MHLHCFTTFVIWLLKQKHSEKARFPSFLSLYPKTIRFERSMVSLLKMFPHKKQNCDFRFWLHIVSHRLSHCLYVVVPLLPRAPPTCTYPPDDAIAEPAGHFQVSVKWHLWKELTGKRSSRRPRFAVDHFPVSRFSTALGITDDIELTRLN